MWYNLRRRLLTMSVYIHERADWHTFRWDFTALSVQLADVRYRQGRFIAKMSELGFQLRREAVLEALTEEVQKSSDIEGEYLDKAQVRSSVARHLGVDIGALAPEDRYVEGVVEIMLDATQQYNDPLTVERLYRWHRG